MAEPTSLATHPSTGIEIVDCLSAGKTADPYKPGLNDLVSVHRAAL